MPIYSVYHHSIIVSQARPARTSSARARVFDPSSDAAGSSGDVSLPEDQPLQAAAARKRQEESHRKRTSTTQYENSEFIKPDHLVLVEDEIVSIYVSILAYFYGPLSNQQNQSINQSINHQSIPFQDKLLSKMEVDEGEFPLPTCSSFNCESEKGFGSEKASGSGLGSGSGFASTVATNSKGDQIAPEDDEVSYFFGFLFLSIYLTEVITLEYII